MLALERQAKKAPMTAPCTHDSLLPWGSQSKSITYPEPKNLKNVPTWSLRVTPTSNKYHQHSTPSPQLPPFDGTFRVAGSGSLPGRMAQQPIHGSMWSFPEKRAQGSGFGVQGVGFGTYCNGTVSASCPHLIFEIHALLANAVTEGFRVSFYDRRGSAPQ